MADKVRIDKWLWSVRIFKSRSQATDACKTNKVNVNGVKSKASTPVVVDDIIDVKKNGFDLVFKVVKLIDRRVSATLAQPCYENLTSEDEMNKYKDWFVGKSSPERRAKGAGRPTKRDRRELEDFKDDWFD